LCQRGIVWGALSEETFLFPPYYYLNLFITFLMSNFDTLYLFKFLVLEFDPGITHFSKEDKAKVKHK
jgi:hypothetical protein